jgi:hypothetical protein
VKTVRVRNPVQESQVVAASSSETLRKADEDTTGAEVFLGSTGLRCRQRSGESGSRSPILTCGATDSQGIDGY